MLPASAGSKHAPPQGGQPLEIYPERWYPCPMCEKQQFYTRRGHLANLGLAKAHSRGRLSHEANAHIENDVANGCTFTDYPTSSNTPKPNPVGKRENKPKTEVKQSTNIPRSTPTGNTPDKVWDENTTKFVDEYGNEAGPFEVCVNCKRSLTYCIHPMPVAPIDQKGKLRQHRVIFRYTKDGKTQLFSPIDSDIPV